MEKYRNGIDWLRGKRTLEPELTEYEKLCQEIEQARLEWAVAKKHVDYVSEAERIDHSIYHLEAAERKYAFLLREAKRQYALSQGQQQWETSFIK